MLQRAGPIKHFVVWCRHRFPLEPFTEPLLFLYLKELQKEGSAPSAAGSLLSALSFVHGTVGLSVPLEALKSARVTGLAHLQLRTRRPPKQAQELTVSQARFLEEVADEDCTSYRSLVAGALCYALYGRARHSDLKRSRDLFFDFSDTGLAGYVEAKVLNPKQARASARSNRLLPLVAPVQGVSPQAGPKAGLQAGNTSA